MTLRGVCVTVFEVFLVILALGTEMKEFLVVALCIGGLMAYSLLSLVLASVTISVKSKINKRAALRDENIKYTLSLCGIALLPVAVYFSLKSDDSKVALAKKEKNSLLLVPTFVTQRNFTFKLPCIHTGRWNVGIRKLRIEDVFGLFSMPLLRAKRADRTVELAVMPKVHSFDETEISATEGGYGASSLLNSETGELLGDSRDYREGDSLKRINWKQSARTKTLHTRQYEMPQKPRIAIIFDTAFSGENMCDSVDVACETAISIAKYFADRNNEVNMSIVRSENENENREYLLQTYNDIMKMQYRFTDISYHKGVETLDFAESDDIWLTKADKFYFITANPSDKLLETLQKIDKIGKSARCIIPEACFDAQSLDRSNDIRLFISSADRIGEKVGAAL